MKLEALNHLQNLTFKTLDGAQHFTPNENLG